jgi:hypothetical protein
LESWEGNSSYIVDRIGRGTISIPALCLSIFGSIQPGVLAEYVWQASSGGQGHDGLLQRFQLMVYPDQPKHWKNIDKKPEGKEEIVQLFKKIAETPLEVQTEVIGIHFNSEAQNTFDEWFANLEKRLRSGEFSPLMESHLGKYRSLCPSLALIFEYTQALSEEGSSDPSNVGVEALQRAILVCEYLESHARRVYAGVEQKGVRSAKELLKHIQKGDLKDRCNQREIYHSKHWSYLRNSEEVKEACEILEACNYIRIEEIRSNAGRPSVILRFHPSLK